MLQIIAVGKNPKKKEISKRLWRIRQGKSEAKVRGDTYDDAKERAAQIGFKKPSSIILIENPKRKAKAKRKRKVICAKKNPAKEFRYEVIFQPYSLEAGQVGKRLSQDIVLSKHHSIAAAKRYLKSVIRGKVKRGNFGPGHYFIKDVQTGKEYSATGNELINARRNPPPRKRHETMIVGFDHGRGRKTKKYWFTGESFSRNRDDAKVYAGDGAKSEAKRILNRLPPAIYGIKVESV